MISSDLLFVMAALLILAAACYRFDRQRFSCKELALIATLAGLSALGRIPFAAIPGVQPTTCLIILTGVVFGPTVGLCVGILSPLVSNVFLGHGPWTIFQMLAWGLCGLSAGVLGRQCRNIGKYQLLCFAVFWGYAFGWIMNSWYWVSFVYPLSFQSWLVTNAVSLPFDSMHALVNAVFILILGEDLLLILKRFRNKLSFRSLALLNPESQEQSAL